MSAGDMSELGSELDSEPFRLVNPRPRVRPSIENNTARQRTLLAGLDCLPGQGDLFATDGELADEPAATPLNPSTGENP
jgi:hypothetical protein